MPQDFETIEPSRQLTLFEEMVCGPWTAGERPLPHSERLVQDEPAGHDGVSKRGKQIALQVPADNNELECVTR
jgi:hypothetical protein